ncbi:hypothetical protein QT231_13920 [Halomonas sp. SpR1]|uniref:hypothetical protein n=1 Tax=Halomonas sp. SpR1 TaxID=3050462 RepID=UPI0027E5948C|nr:hypothetical protein [Halomonas sp. SpR1]MDQ7733806.1 hypothetical protein [Halomonas sp. SpR1]
MAYEKIFNGNGDTFSAKHEAEKWLRDNGYSVGSSCVGHPQGVLQGEDICIAKMKNLTKSEIKQLDGLLYAGSDGDGRLVLKEAPSEA